LITLGITTLIPFIFSFGPFILMVDNVFFVDYEKLKILFDRINCHKYFHDYFHLNVDFVMLIGHQMYGRYIMFLIKLWLLLVRMYIISERFISINLGRSTRLFYVRSISVSMTSGLVQDIEHQVLPSITPTMTFILTIIFMIVIISYSFFFLYSSFFLFL